MAHDRHSRYSSSGDSLHSWIFNSGDDMKTRKELEKAVEDADAATDDAWVAAVAAKADWVAADVACDVSRSVWRDATAALKAYDEKNT